MRYLPGEFDAGEDGQNRTVTARTIKSRVAVPGAVAAAKQQIRFTADRAHAVAELCGGAEAAITAIRNIATGSALDDAALAKFLDENDKLL